MPYEVRILRHLDTSGPILTSNHVGNPRGSFYRRRAYVPWKNSYGSRKSSTMTYTMCSTRVTCSVEFSGRLIFCGERYRPSS